MQRGMDFILASTMYECTVVYVEGVIVFCKSPLSSVNYIDIVIRLLKPAEMTLNWKKIYCFSESINYLDLVISTGELQVIRTTTDAVEPPR